jgi:hypothetical protein
LGEADVLAVGDDGFNPTIRSLHIAQFLANGGR